MNKHFPINFFQSIFSVKQIFSNRNKFKWWQLGIIFIFIQSLVMIPLSLGLVQRGTELVDAFLPTEFTQIDSDASTQIQQLTFNEGQLAETSEKIIYQASTLIVGTNLPEALTQDKLALDFTQDYAVVTLQKDQAFYDLRLVYTDEFIGKLKEATIYEGLKTEMYHQNSGPIFLSTILNIGGILFAMNALLILGISVLFYLTKKASAIHSLKESVTLSLSLVSGGSLLAMLVGFLTTDIFILFGIQSLWLIGMSLTLYVKTRFKRTVLNEAVNAK